MMKNECDIVRDLLNNEEILSNTSKDFIKKHLEKCDSCTKFFCAMKNKNEQEVEIDYLKKIRKKLNVKNIITIILSIIIVLLILLDSVFFYNYYKKMDKINQNIAIINNLKSNAKQYENLDNYSYTITSKNLFDNDENIIKFYVLGNAFVYEDIGYTNEGNEVHEYAYCSGKNDIIYLNRDGQKSISIYKGKSPYLFNNMPCNLTSLSDMVYGYNMLKIEEYYADNQNYYILTPVGLDYKYIAEKDTGIIVKSISDDFTYEINYEIGNVTNEDIDRIGKIMNVDENTTIRDYLR